MQVLPRILTETNGIIFLVDHERRLTHTHTHQSTRTHAYVLQT